MNINKIILVLIILISFFSCKTIDATYKIDKNHSNNHYDSLIVFDMSKCTPVQFILGCDSVKDKSYNKFTLSKFKTFIYKTKPYSIIYAKSGNSYYIEGIYDYGYELKSIPELRERTIVTTKKDTIHWGGELIFKTGFNSRYDLEYKKKPEGLNEVLKYISESFNDPYWQNIAKISLEGANNE